MCLNGQLFYISNVLLVDSIEEVQDVIEIGICHWLHRPQQLICIAVFHKTEEKTKVLHIDLLVICLLNYLIFFK
jgi:hypothetical protein